MKTGSPFSIAQPIERGWYLGMGVGLLIVKIAIDYALATFIFRQQWTPAEYVAPGSSLAMLVSQPAQRVFYATMLAIALPFIATGILLTARRLRSVGASIGWTLLFFVPAINFLMFALLSVLPSRGDETIAPAVLPPPPPAPPPPLPHSAGNVLPYGHDETAPPTWLQRAVPRDPPFGTLTAIVVPAALALAATFLSVHVLSLYGFAVFVGVPFVIGLLAAMLYGAQTAATTKGAAGVACLSLTLYGVVLLVLAFEGAGCLIMTAPLAYPITLLGALVGWSLRPRPRRFHDARSALLIMLIALPLFMGAEYVGHPAPTVYAVTTAVEIDAPPDVVWANVIGFGEIPPPRDWIFRAGVAYPIRADIQGRGIGAVRHCVFSTGAFVEPIITWDEPRLLKFDVTSNPPPMREWSPYHINPPHLHDFLVSHGGQFRLIELPAGRTRLEGTTWYQHRTWPEGYWRLWSDFIIHRIHLRVLNHVKSLSEAPVTPPP